MNVRVHAAAATTSVSRVMTRHMSTFDRSIDHPSARARATAHRVARRHGVRELDAAR